MTIQLSTHAKERSTFIIIASFTDENGTAVTPTSVKWSLTDYAGNVINDRNDESETPASSVAIVLKGSDLEHNGDNLPRVVTVKGLYNSSTYGDDLPMRESVEFIIDNLIAIPSSSLSPSISPSTSPSISPSTSPSPSA